MHCVITLSALVDEAQRFGDPACIGKPNVFRIVLDFRDKSSEIGQG
jgi:hypothetical protein